MSSKAKIILYFRKKNVLICDNAIFLVLSICQIACGMWCQTARWKSEKHCHASGYCTFLVPNVWMFRNTYWILHFSPECLELYRHSKWQADILAEHPLRHMDVGGSVLALKLLPRQKFTMVFWSRWYILSLKGLSLQ